MIMRVLDIQSTDYTHLDLVVANKVLYLKSSIFVVCLQSSNSTNMSEIFFETLEVMHVHFKQYRLG